MRLERLQKQNIFRFQLGQPYKNPSAAAPSRKTLYSKILLLCILISLPHTSSSFQLNMVEGHSVHRVASLHRKRLVGKRFVATSPNGRFEEGANRINGKVFSRIEAVGKNLFAFFVDNETQNEENNGNENDDDVVVVHVHFGMAGVWAVYLLDNETPPEPTSTNRLRLEHDGIVADLSAMTVQYGGMDLYNGKRAKLGEDPLRDDANPTRLWERVKSNKRKSIGALLMDQSYFTGPGNIYRAEILFKAGIHPDRLGNELEKHEFDLIWHHTTALLRRGYQSGSIVTVDPNEAKILGMPNLRRYIYNSSKCPRCGSSIKTWQINKRTCYACNSCQPRKSTTRAAVVTPQRSDCVPFNSHCARETAESRLKQSGPWRLTIKELKAELSKLGKSDFPSNMKKGQFVELLLLHQTETRRKSLFISSEKAAVEKALAGESLAVEHIAELAPEQARRARSKVVVVKNENNSSKLTVPQIKEQLRILGVKFPSKGKKMILLELLNDNKQINKQTIATTAPVTPYRVKSIDGLGDESASNLTVQLIQESDCKQNLKNATTEYQFKHLQKRKRIVPVTPDRKVKRIKRET